MRREIEIVVANIQENIPLAQHCHYKIGGPARFFCEAASEEEIRSAILFAREKRVPIFILGSGTNLLFADEGFDGLVLKPSLKQILPRESIVEVGAGALVSELLDFTVVHSLSGLEWAGGLPGTVGGAVRGNAGAFKGEIKDRIASVDSLDVDTLEKLTRDNPACHFGYRSSIYKEKGGREVILSTRIRLEKGESTSIAAGIQEKINYRLQRHPMEFPNTGSTFKNLDLSLVPERFRQAFASHIKMDPFPVIPTAFLITEAGLKGTRQGGAMVSAKHANFIINANNATSADVKELIDIVKKRVFEKFEIRLEEEIQIV
ncbi:MAG TPA: UDP-N-acetylmuramate dehydrogenase [Candidatus Acidoferrales bacterium]|nr:UDP-N-acetylmuramate dehydrogenase [Candidatus Acidoferrales bacterium]